MDVKNGQKGVINNFAVFILYAYGVLLFVKSL